MGVSPREVSKSEEDQPQEDAEPHVQFGTFTGALSRQGDVSWRGGI